MTTVTAPVNPLSNTTIFITSVIVNERLNHTQLKMTITPMFMKPLFRLLVKPCHHLHPPHLFNNIYTFASCVSACTALKVWLRHLDRIVFSPLCPAVVKPVRSRNWSGIPHKHIFGDRKVNRSRGHRVKDIPIHILGVDHTILRANRFGFSGVFLRLELNSRALLVQSGGA